MAAISELLSLVAFLATIVFFAWFVSTLGSINKRIGKIADHAERQTKLLASIAKAIPEAAQTGEASLPVANVMSAPLAPSTSDIDEKMRRLQATMAETKKDQSVG